MNHCSLPTPFKAFVETSVLYNMDTDMTGLTECTVFGVSSYTGHYPTFQILLGCGAMFSYIPAHLLLTTEKPKRSFLLSELVYHKCMSDQISFTVFEELRSKPVTAFVGVDRRAFKAEYIGTIDWIKGNELLHLLLLGTGHIALLPSHKLLFGVSNSTLPAFKKLRALWT
jgi:hypothetical protein